MFSLFNFCSCVFFFTSFHRLADSQSFSHFKPRTIHLTGLCTPHHHAAAAIALSHLSSLHYVVFFMFFVDRQTNEVWMSVCLMLIGKYSSRAPQQPAMSPAFAEGEMPGQEKSPSLFCSIKIRPPKTEFGTNFLPIFFAFIFRV